MKADQVVIVICLALVFLPNRAVAVFIADTNISDNNMLQLLSGNQSGSSVSESYGESVLTPYTNQFGTFAGLGGPSGRFFDKAVTFAPGDFNIFTLFFTATNNTTETWNAYIFDFFLGDRPTISVLGANSITFGAPQVSTDTDSTTLFYTGVEIVPGQQAVFSMTLQKDQSVVPIDLIQVAIVPIPAALPLLLSALGILALISRIRQGSGQA